MFRPKSAPSLKTRMAMQAQQKQVLLSLANSNSNKEMKTQHTKLLFALNDKDVLQNNLYLKEQQITDMAKLMEKINK